MHLKVSSAKRPQCVKYEDKETRLARQAFQLSMTRYDPGFTYISKNKALIFCITGANVNYDVSLNKLEHKFAIC